MSEYPPTSPVRSTRTGADADPTATPVTVRLTDSTAHGGPSLSALYATDATLGFPSVAAAYAFEERLDRATDDHELQLTPDHQSDATFFLRFQRVRR